MSDSGAVHDMKHARRTIWWIVAAAVGVPLISVLVPKPHGSILATPEFMGTLFGTFLQATLYVGAILLFLQGLKDFKPVLKKAYFLICAGLAVFVVTYLQVPFLLAFNLFESAWFTEGGLAGVFSLGMVLMVVGLCVFARALAGASLWTRPEFLTIFLLALTVVAGFTTPDRLFSTGFATSLASTIIPLAGMFLALHIKRSTGAAYTYAMAWLFLALLSCVVNGMVTAVQFYFDLDQTPLQIIPSLTSAISFIKAGYAFNKIQEY